jgi:hypothetical protein
MMDLQGFLGSRGLKADDNGVAEIGGEFSCYGLMKLACHEGVAGAQWSAPVMKDSWAQKNSPAATDSQGLEGDRLPVMKMLLGWKEMIEGDTTANQPTSTREEEESEEK